MARRLIVEITETAAIQEIDETARFVAAVRDLGCRVALDDFGVGYSSFQHLKSLPVDLVKIDGSFVDDMAEDERSRLFVRSEEHTSELQVTNAHLVCRLLLEKKKK